MCCSLLSVCLCVCVCHFGGSLAAIQRVRLHQMVLYVERWCHVNITSKSRVEREERETSSI